VMGEPLRGFYAYRSSVRAADWSAGGSAQPSVSR
jgi:hypothetical protein